MTSNWPKFFAALAVLTGLAAILQAHAQTAAEPQLFITWQAASFVPADYEGKVLPTNRTKISAAVELIDRGRVIDLRNQVIYWYVNDQLFDNKVGRQTLEFLAPAIGQNSIDLRVELPNIPGSEPVLKTIEIPVVSPQAVIQAPYPENKFYSSPIELKALPYFFNVVSADRLSYAWNINGETPKNALNPDTLTVNLNADAASQSVLNISLDVSNPSARSEHAFTGTSLTYLK